MPWGMSYNGHRKESKKERTMGKKKLLITGINGGVGSVLKDKLGGDYEGG